MRTRQDQPLLTHDLEPENDTSLASLARSPHQIVAIILGSNSVAHPAIYVNLGDGFRETEGHKFPLSAAGDGVYTAEFVVSRSAQGTPSRSYDKQRKIRARAYLASARIQLAHGATKEELGLSSDPSPA